MGERVEKYKRVIKRFQAMQPADDVTMDYLKNVVVKFLALSHSLTEEQESLCAVLGTVLNFSDKEKTHVDRNYFSKTYPSLTSQRRTLFPKLSKKELGMARALRKGSTPPRSASGSAQGNSPA